MINQGYGVFTPRRTSAKFSADYQPLGSMPNRLSSLRPSVFIQLPKLIPASAAAASNCALSSGVMRIWKVGDHPIPFGDLSRLIVDMYVRNPLVCFSSRTYINTRDHENKTPPNDITSAERGLTTSNRPSIEVAMNQNTTPLIGRNSHTLIPHQPTASQRTKMSFGQINLMRSITRLPLLNNLGYSACVAPQWAIGCRSLNTNADTSRFTMRFFCVRKPCYSLIMVGRSGGAFALAGFIRASLLTLLRLTTPFRSGQVRLKNFTNEAVTMATTPTQTHSKFLWRFYSSHQHAYHTVTAQTETEARTLLPSGWMVFTARIRQGVSA